MIHKCLGGCQKNYDTDKYTDFTDTDNDGLVCRECITYSYFECKNCGKTLHWEEKAEKNDKFCQECYEESEECLNEDAGYWDYINSEIDRRLGK